MPYYRLIDDELVEMVFQLVLPTPPPLPSDPWSGMVIVFAASEGGTGENVWEATTALDVALGNTQGEPIPFFAGRHTYSGNSFPATFPATSAGPNPGYGWTHSVLNVKVPNWSDLANGAMDSRISGLVPTIPQGHKVYLIINHEPENDNKFAERATWRAGQARAGNLIAAINDPRLEFAVCHMAYTWVPGSGRNPDDWNPANPGGTIEMTPAALARTIFAPDGYTDVENSAGTAFQTMAERFDPIWDDATAWGFERFAISEHALNNDVGAPPNKLVDIWEGDHFPYIESMDLVYYAGYSSEGPAAGTNARLDTPEELGSFGAWVKKHKYGL